MGASEAQAQKTPAAIQAEIASSSAGPLLGGTILNDITNSFFSLTATSLQPVNVGTDPVPGGLFSIGIVNMGASLNSAGNAGAGSANQFLQVIETHIAPTNSLATYEKGGLIVETHTNDPSNFVGGLARDAVGVDARCAIDNTNTQGRCTALAILTGIDSGGVGDGFFDGLEMDLVNNGTYQADPANSTGFSKYGQQIAAFGPNDMTVGTSYINGGARFFAGIYAAASAIRTDGFFLDYDNFKVTQSGKVVASDTITSALVISTGAGGGFQINRRDTLANSWTWYSAAGNLELFDQIAGADALTMATGGQLNAVNGFSSGGNAGVTCNAGISATTGRSVNGIITHC